MVFSFLCVGLSLFLSAATGFFFADAFLVDLGRGRGPKIAKALLGIGPVLVAKTMLAFLFLLMFNRITRGFLVVEGLMFLMGLGLWRHSKSRRDSIGQVPLTVEEEEREGRLMFPEWVMAGAALVILVYVAIVGLTDPLGWWDAFASWNVSAKWLDSDSWRTLFTVPRKIAGNPFVHLYLHDHPPFNPLLTATLWAYWGKQVPFVPALMSVVFLLLNSALLFSVLWIFAGRTAAIAGTAVLLAIPRFAIYGSVQYMDIPFAFFVLVFTVSCLWVWGEGVRPAWMGPLLLGLSASLPVWAKNEGVVFFLVAFVLYVVGVVLRFFRTPSDAFRRIALFVLGALFSLTMWGLFKTMLIDSRHAFLSRQPAGWISIRDKLLDRARYVEALKHLFRHLRERTYVGPFLGVLAWAGVLLGQQRGGKVFVPLPPSGLVYPSVVLLAQFIAYYMVFVITPFDVAWHSSAIDRLILHFLPSGVLLFLLLSILLVPFCRHR